MNAVFRSVARTDSPSGAEPEAAQPPSTARRISVRK